MSKISPLLFHDFVTTQSPVYTHVCRDRWQDITGTTIVLFHGNCHDGLVAAAIYAMSVKLLTPDTFTRASQRNRRFGYIPVQYGSEPPIVPIDTTHIVILDFSYDEDVLLKAYPGIDILQLDHHETAYKRYSCGGTKGYCRLHQDGHFKFPTPSEDRAEMVTDIDMDHSGAMMAFLTFIPSPSTQPLVRQLHSFAKYAEDRDLWKFQHKETEAFTLMLRDMVPKNLVGDLCELISEWERNRGQHGKDLLKRYSNIVDYENRRIQSMVDKAMLFVDDGGKLAALCSYTGKDASNLGSAVLNSYPEIEYVILYVLTPYKAYLSMRSKGGQALVAAEALGGGGHANAAGANIDCDAFVEKFFSLVRKYNAEQKVKS